MWLTLGLLALATTSVVSVPVSAVKNTSVGALRCNKLSTGVMECLGLPFAAPPTGPLRFAATVDAVGPLDGSGPFDATSFGAACPQAAGQIPDPGATSEDCLTINVWSPATSNSDDDSPPAAVMHWIYGGGFAQGGSASFNGSTLAARHDVVVVSSNYRLGALGFTALREHAARNGTTGNWAFLDQQSALRWVQRNVATGFGGDPDLVTIFGQSAGAGSVDAHLLAPTSGGLYTRAILESGGLDGIVALPWALGVGDGVAARLGCGNYSATAAAADADAADAAGGGGGDRLRCMRAASVEQVLAASGGGDMGNPVIACAFGRPEDCTDFTLAADGVVFDGSAWDLTVRSSDAVNTNADVMLGTNTNDGSLFAIGYFDSLNASGYAELVRAVVSKDQRLKGNADPTPAQLQRALALYPPAPEAAGVPLANVTAANLATLSTILTDSQFLCGSQLIASGLASGANKSRGVFQYRYNYNATFAGFCYSSWSADYGITHTAELSMVFGQPTYVFGPITSDLPACTFNAEDAAMAQLVGELWTSFAKGGAPTATSDVFPKASGWPRWDAASEQQLVIDAGPLKVEARWRAEQCAYWTSTERGL